MSNKQKITLQGTFTKDHTGARLDQALANLFTKYSRAQIQTWIKQGIVFVDGKVCTKSRLKVEENQAVLIEAELAPNEQWQPEPIELSIVYEDTDIIVVNKPPGLITHPGAGNPNHTLVNALLYHHPELNTLPRAGIIHRLDKDTSGLLVIAKTIEAYNELVKAMKARDIKREYLAIIKGCPISGKTIDAPIGRHPTARIKMAVTPSGQKAITHFRVLEKFDSFSLIRVSLETGRTHQIRVHMLHIQHPIVGDPIYGKHLMAPKQISETVKTALKHFHRQALHAEHLAFLHPITQAPLAFTAPLPKDMETLLHALQTSQSD